MLGLLDELAKSDRISESTARNYINNLYTLNNKKPFKNLAFLKNKTQVMTALKPYADTTQRTFLAGIVSVLDMVKGKRGYGKLLGEYRTILNDKAKEIEARPKNVKNGKQEEAWLDWEEIQKIKDDLKDKVVDIHGRRQITLPQRNTLLQYVILSLFTDIPPRRNQDYSLMYVIKKEYPGLSEDKNYYSIDDQKLIFNKYKTAKTYGKVEIDISDNPPLKDALRLYLIHHPHKPARWGKTKEIPLLVKNDGTPFSSVNGITRLLHKIFKKKIGSSMLRHIYLTTKYGDQLTEMKEDAEAMGHSTDQQRDYIKNEDEEDLKTEVKNERTVVEVTDEDMDIKGGGIEAVLEGLKKE